MIFQNLTGEGVASELRSGTRRANGSFLASDASSPVRALTQGKLVVCCVPSKLSTSARSAWNSTACNSSSGTRATC